MRVVTLIFSPVAARAPRGPLEAGSGAMDLPCADARKADHVVGGSARRVA